MLYGILAPTRLPSLALLADLGYTNVKHILKSVGHI
jgi:hypothetical protein